MSTPANFQSWAKERLDEMELRSPFSKTKRGGAGRASQPRAERTSHLTIGPSTVSSECRQEACEANEAALVAAKAKLEVDWKGLRG